MTRIAVAVLLLAAAGCASGTDATATSPAALTAPDPSIGELQTTLTELLERLDVLNARIARLEAGTSSSEPSQPARRQPQPAPRSPEPVDAAPASIPTSPSTPLAGAQLADTYRNALMLYGKGKAIEARKAFQEIFSGDPTGDLADNSLFWIGETYYATGEFVEAMRYYRRIVTDFGSQNKAPDALYKMALSLEKTGDLALARSTLQEVIQKYPYSAPAASAKLELKRIKY